MPVFELANLPAGHGAANVLAVPGLFEGHQAFA
jgi:hypothetical protein